MLIMFIVSASQLVDDQEINSKTSLDYFCVWGDVYKQYCSDAENLIERISF